MRIRGALLALFVGFSVVHLVGQMFSSPPLPVAPVLAWGCLLGYAVAAGAGVPPKVRWPLLAGLLALGVRAFGEWWPQVAEPATDSSLAWQAAETPDLSSEWAGRFGYALPLFVACGLFAAAVLAGWADRRPPGPFWSAPRTVVALSVTATAAAMTVGFTVLRLWLLSGPLTDYDWRLAVGVLAACAAAVAAIVAAGGAALRGGIGWLAAAGLGVLALSALSAMGDLVLAAPVSPSAFVVPGVVYQTSISEMPLDSYTRMYLLSIAFAAVQLAAVAAVTVGWLRASRRPDATAVVTG